MSTTASASADAETPAPRLSFIDRLHVLIFGFQRAAIADLTAVRDVVEELDTDLGKLEVEVTTISTDLAAMNVADVLNRLGRAEAAIAAVTVPKAVSQAAPAPAPSDVAPAVEATAPAALPPPAAPSATAAVSAAGASLAGASSASLPSAPAGQVAPL